MANKKIHDHLAFSNYFIPIYLYKEFRNSVRFSVTKKGMVIRCPFITNSSKITEQAKLWCESTIKNKPGAFTDFQLKDYTVNSTIQLYGDIYNINIGSTNSGKDSITWKDFTLNIVINDNYNKVQRSKAITHLITKFAIKRYINSVTQRVTLLNQKYFNVAVEKVRLKNNRSNWGSCSNKGNINLSVRLLRAPLEVIDYVIIHELAHRIEMNHSKKFWELVLKACPDYREKERWLKQNSHLCTL